MLSGHDVIVQDEIETDAPVEAWWFMHTGAEVKCDGAIAVMTQNGRQLTATLLSPAGAVFEVMPAEPLATSPHPERQQVKHTSMRHPRKLAVHVGALASPRFTVLLSPGGSSANPALPPALAEWR